MLKEKRHYFEALLVAADLIVVAVSWVLAYWVRFELELFPVEKGVPPFENYLSLVLLILLIWPVVFRNVGLYRPMRGTRPFVEVWTLIHGNTLAILLFLATIYLFREKTVPFSRLVFLYFWAFSTFFTILQRVALRSFLRELRRKGFNLRYLVIVGAGKVAEDLISRVRSHRELGIQLLGCFSLTGTEATGPLQVPIIGAYSELGSYLGSIQVDQVVVAVPLQDHDLLPEIMRYTRETLADVKIVPDHYQFISLAGAIEEFEGIPVLNVQSTPLEGWGRVIKRCFDIIVGLFLSVVLAPLLILLTLLIKLTSRGPVLYFQERMSVDGTRFHMIKFRTMRLDAEKNGPGWTTPGDERVTGFGKFLRSTSLDELPQIFNVLKGDMSFVGPRPERPIFIQEFRQRIPRYMLRHKVPAGMTGWAQVNGWRGDSSIDRRIECDLYYIQHWSLFFDIKILWLTIFRGFRSQNAY